MPSITLQRPTFTLAEAAAIVSTYYGRSGQLTPLPSERDQNFHLHSDDGDYVLKIAGLTDPVALLEMQNAALAFVAARQPGLTPQVVTAVSGETILTIPNGDSAYPVRLLTYLPGVLYAHLPAQDAALQASLGRRLGQLDHILSRFEHPAAHREDKWNLAQASFISGYTQYIQDSTRRTLVERFLALFEADVLPRFPGLRHQLIHNDANDYNVLCQQEAGQTAVTAVIDFGDLIYAPPVCEAAIAAAYALLGQPDPLLAAAPVVRGYHGAYPLLDDELDILFTLIAMRLCVSVTLSSYQQTQHPDDAYLQVSAGPAWAALEKLAHTDPAFAHLTFRHACGLEPLSQRYLTHKHSGRGALVTLAASTNLLEDNSSIHPLSTPVRSHLKANEIAHLRQAHLGPNLSLSYRKPLHIVRGYMQYLVEANGRIYLDAVNNVPHVGHCHPHVVRAGQQQMALLNTNTRYLHDYLGAYAARLAARFPDPLSVVYFVCSGSEANELALRLARTVTSRRDLLVLDGGYHGNTGELINISAYKFNGRGGQGAPPYVHPLPMPDPYRGEHKGYGEDAGRHYAQYARAIIARLQARDTPPAAFIAEAQLGCGGQIVLPDGYLAAVYDAVHAAGGLCIADEVQVGFGRVGTHFWGFETQNVVPDIVTMGKPMGNGHPLAAVITTPEIAAAFDNGMEYFNTFGGNPVSCAIGMAVLDVIEQEDLQANALTVGSYLMDGLRQLQERHERIGDVRGLGLYNGVELVRNRETLEPAGEEASAIANAMKERGILISTDGPLHNVLKIKPPIIFTKENADQLVETLNEILCEM